MVLADKIKNLDDKINTINLNIIYTKKQLKFLDSHLLN